MRGSTHATPGAMNVPRPLPDAGGVGGGRGDRGEVGRGASAEVPPQPAKPVAAQPAKPVERASASEAAGGGPAW